jgi:hypothetical protein
MTYLQARIESQTHFFKAIKASAIATILVALLLSLLAFLPAHSDPEASLKQSGPQALSICGSNHVEAHSLNCKFDPMSFSWLPSTCYDSELTEQFLSLRGWKWTFVRAGNEGVAATDEGQLSKYMQICVGFHHMHHTLCLKAHVSMLRRVRSTAYMAAPTRLNKEII